MSTPYRPRWPLLLTLIIGAMSLIAIVYLAEGSEPTADERPARGGSYIEGVAGAPNRINPLFASFNEVDRDLSSLIFSGLVRLGPKGDVQPDLAEKWTISPDGLTYIFQLRPGLLWHDGEPLDSDDVVFTIQAIQDPGFRGDQVLADLFKDVELEAPNALTVIMTRPQPFAPFLAYTTVGILPKHLLAGLGPNSLYRAPFNNQPIGSGPFRLADITSNEAVLEAFESYHLGQPLLERLELRFYRDDAALITALRNDEVEGALLRPGLSLDDLAFFDGDARWTRRSLHTPSYSLVYLNPEVPAFESGRVRRAFQHALDREALIDEVLAGQALPVDSPISRDLWAYVSNANAYVFDPPRANALLNAAGWVRVDGVREKDGEPLKLTLSASDDPIQTRVAHEIARQWGLLGIQVDVQVSSVSEFTKDILLPRNFDAALRTISPPGPDPDPYPFWHSTQAVGDGLNLANFSDLEADRLLETARLEPSLAERAENYQEFQKIFSLELPAVLLYTATYQYIVNADVRDVTPGLLFTLSARFHDVQRWSVETEPLSDTAE